MLVKWTGYVQPTWKAAEYFLRDGGSRLVRGRLREDYIKRRIAGEGGGGGNVTG